LEQICDNHIPRLRAKVALAVDADADGVRFEVALADDEHGVDFHLLGVGDLALMWSLLASSSQRTCWARSSA
jgi:hypothetical protein